MLLSGIAGRTFVFLRLEIAWKWLCFQFRESSREEIFRVSFHDISPQVWGAKAAGKSLAKADPTWQPPNRYVCLTSIICWKSSITSQKGRTYLNRKESPVASVSIRKIPRGSRTYFRCYVVTRPKLHTALPPGGKLIITKARLPLSKISQLYVISCDISLILDTKCHVYFVIFWNSFFLCKKWCPHPENNTGNGRQLGRTLWAPHMRLLNPLAWGWC